MEMTQLLRSMGAVLAGCRYFAVAAVALFQVKGA